MFAMMFKQKIKKTKQNPTLFYSAREALKG